MSAVPALSRAWRLSLLIVLLLAGAFLLYRPSSASLMALWNDTGRITYTHGFLIAAIAVWMVLRRREELAALPRAPSLLAAALTLPVALAWFLAVRAGIEVVHQVLLVGLLWLAVWSVFGWRVARALWLPVGFLLFAVPVWDLSMPLLQRMTTHAVHLLLKVVGIPAYMDGNDVHVAAGIFEVAGGCSGIHYFLVSLALGTLYGELGRDTLKMRALLLALAVGFALLSNWLRVFIIVVAGHLTNMQHYLIRKEHYTFGWGVFAVMMVVYLLIARRIAPPASEARVPPAAAASGARPNVPATVVALAAVALVPAWESLNPVTAARLPDADGMGRVPAGWGRVSGVTPAWNPVFTGADRIELYEYAKAGGQRLAAARISYALQKQDKELVSWSNSLVGADEGAVVESHEIGGGRARELVVEGARERYLIHYHYDVGGHITGRDLRAQLWYGFESLRRPTGSSLIAWRTPCVPDCDAARSLLSEYSRDPIGF
jgi:exosortase A